MVNPSIFVLVVIFVDPDIQSPTAKDGIVTERLDHGSESEGPRFKTRSRAAK
jgi:hypothetical protein